MATGTATTRRLEARIARLETDRDDYERRWLEECRARGILARHLEQAEALLRRWLLVTLDFHSPEDPRADTRLWLGCDADDPEALDTRGASRG